MGFPIERKIKAWSFSRWWLYKRCPRWAMYKFIERRPEESGPAAQRGDAVDKMAESFLRGDLRVLPPELQSVSREMFSLRAAGAVPQMSIAFTREWVECSPTDWDNAWVRVKMDVVLPPNDGTFMYAVTIKDFKTGKMRDPEESGYGHQLNLYCLAGLLKYPRAERARSELVFTDHGKTIPIKVEPARADVPKMKKDWEDRVRPMLTDTVFAPNPGYQCSYCPHSKRKGGPCEY